MDLPQLIDPVECLSQEKTYHGSLTSHQLPRLAEFLMEPAEAIEFSLRFDRDEQGRCVVKCHVKAGLPMQCQRCGQPMILPVDSTTALCAVANDALAKALPAQYEPLVTENAPVALLDIVEEELLLAVPMIPRHAQGACPSVKRTAAA